MPIIPPESFKQFDIEDFIVLTRQFLIDNFNTWIAQMNTDKPTPVLADIDDLAYFIQTLDDSIINFEPFVFIAEIDVAADAQPSATGKRFRVDVGVILAQGNDANDQYAKRILRYREVLERLFEKGYDRIDRRLKIEVESLTAFPLEAVNSNKKYVASGVSLGFNFA